MTDSPIPLIDLKAQYARIEADVNARIQRVLAHGQFIMGPEVAELEAQLAEFAGCRHALGVGSGTDALLIALMAKGIGRGDAVFLPSFTFTATAEVPLLLGATPVFVDIDPVSYNLDPADLERRIDEAKRKGLTPRAVIPVDLFGLPADYAAIAAIAARDDLFVLADAAQSFGARIGNVRVGSLAPATATSFFPAKPLGGFGDGGAILTDDREFFETCRSIRVHGQGNAKYEIVRIGVNGRLDTLQAAVLMTKLAIFAGELDAREQVAQWYAELLDPRVTAPRVPTDRRSAWAQYTIAVDDRDTLAAALKAAGIGSAIYYPLPMHLQAPHRPYGGGEGSLPHSEAASHRVLSLPMYPYLAREQVARVCATIAAALDRRPG